MEVYSEKQYFDQWWFKLLLYAGAGFCLYACVQQLVYKIPFGDKPVSDTGLILMCLGYVLFYWFFHLVRLEFSISTDGISYRFRPFHKNERNIKAEQIKSVTIEKYKPIVEYGGWGIRYGRKGLAMTTAGNRGLRIVLHSGKTLLIGVLDPEELQAYLSRNSMPFEVSASVE